MQNLVSGAKVKIPNNELALEVFWASAAPTIPKLNITAFLLGDNNKICTPETILSVDQPTLLEGALNLSTTTGHVVLKICFQVIPTQVRRVTVAITMADADFSKIHTLRCVAHDFAQFTFNDIAQYKALVLCEVYQHNGEWRLNVSGQGFVNSIKQLYSHYGAPLPQQKASTEQAQNSLPPPDTAPITNNPLRIYRFALFGSTNAGKTVLLAALGMDHVSLDNSNYNCTRLPLPPEPNHNKPTSEKAERYRALEEGKAALDKAIDALKNGRLPEPTASDHAKMIFDFDFSDGQRTYRIELIDYSGESLDSTLSNTERASRLREQLKDKDALLVLAPTPHLNSGASAFDDDGKRLHSLKESFSLLHSERGERQLSIPVAMILTKWDRIGNLTDQNMQQAQQRLKEFLNQKPVPPHHGLFNALRSAVANPDRYFEVFPISAIGECNTNDRPKSLLPLHSFGLEEPFIWAAQRRDEIDVAIYRNDLNSTLKPTAKWFIPWPFSIWSLVHRGRKLNKELLTTDPLYSEAKHLLGQATFAFVTRIAITFIIAASMLLISEWSWDFWRYQVHKHTIDDPQAAGPAVQAAEKWFASYSESPLHWLAKRLVLTATQAEGQLTVLRHGREEVYWAEVQHAESPKKQLERAQQYLTVFPNGHHRPDAIGLVANIAAQGNWDEFYKVYVSTLKAGKTVEAATMLQQRNADKNITPLIENFEQAALNYLESAIQQALEKGNIEAAYALHGQILQWPIDLKLRTSVGIKKEKQLIQQINRVHDQNLYEEARNNRSSDLLHRYLASAPLKTMQNEVQAYLDWLNAQTQPMKLTLSVRSVRWKKDADSNTQLTVLIDDTPVIIIPDIKADAGTTSAFDPTTTNNTYKVTARLNDKLKIRVDTKEMGCWVCDDQSSGVKHLKVNNINGETIEMQTESTINASVTLNLTGIPGEPTLPAWR